MKPGKRICGVLTLVFLSSLGSAVFAQRQEITKARFDKVKTAAERLLSKETFRIRYTGEVFIGTKISTDRLITEYIEPDRRHYFSGFDSADKMKRYEMIKIGDAIFSKRGDADWTKASPPKVGFPPGPKPRSHSRPSAYYALPNEKIDGKEFKRYEVEFRSEGRVSGSGEAFTLNILTAYWIDMDGRFVKIVRDYHQSNLLPMRDTKTYEYDPNIKIEPPPIE